jgi:hypothetical protein
VSELTYNTDYRSSGSVYLADNSVIRGKLPYRMAPHVKVKRHPAIPRQLILNLIALDGLVAQATRRASPRSCPNRRRYIAR